MGPGLGGEPEPAVDDSEGAPEGVEKGNHDQGRQDHGRGPVVEEFPKRQPARKYAEVDLEERVGQAEPEVGGGEQRRVQPGAGTATDPDAEDEAKPRRREVERPFGQPDQRLGNFTGLEQDRSGDPEQVAAKPGDRGPQTDEFEGTGHDGEPSADQGGRLGDPGFPEPFGGKLRRPPAQDQDDDGHRDAADEAALAAHHRGQALTP